MIVAAAERLQAEGVMVRCVSMPSWELFDLLPVDERNAVLPPSVSARLAVEAGVAQGWDRYVGAAGDILCVDRFSASAPGDVLLREFFVKSGTSFVRFLFGLGLNFRGGHLVSTTRGANSHRNDRNKHLQSVHRFSVNFRR